MNRLSEAEPNRLRRLIRSAAVDLSPLREVRDFRLLFIGQGISFLGTMFTSVLLPYQVYELTKSSLAVAMLGIAQVVPTLLTAMVGGALADRVDRRRLIVICELALAVVSAGLLANCLAPGAPALWPIYLSAACISAIEGIQQPSLDSLTPRLLPQNQLAAGAALNSIRMGIGFTLGPALAGFVISGFGVSGGYVIDLASFAGSLTALALISAQPPASEDESLSFRAVAEGIRYATSRRDLLGTYVVDFSAMLFGTPTALFPQLADSLGGPSALGLLYAAPSVGVLIMSSTSGWTNGVRRRGRMVVVAAALWGLTISLLSLAHSLWFALAVLFAAGIFDGISMIFRSTIWNESVPDKYRGRLAGLEAVSTATGPPLGNVEAGAVAATAGLRTSIATGGLACALTAVIMAFVTPALWRYDSRDHTAPEPTGEDSAPEEAKTVPQRAANEPAPSSTSQD